ncbi:RNA methyltransferase [Nanoarchaeota archaeon]
MVSVVLIEPAYPGNIGSVCRVMANFDLKDLVIINPKCDIHASDAIKMSKHGSNILKKAKIKDFDYLKKFDHLVGTTAKIGRDHNISRVPIIPSELKVKPKMALLIGREDKGLTNKEIRMCDFIVSIPASKKYPTLNLAQSCAILFYEIFKGKSQVDHIRYATKNEKDQIMKVLKEKMKKMEFATEGKKETQIKVWKRLLGKSFLTKREAMALIGFMKKI